MVPWEFNQGMVVSLKKRSTSVMGTYIFLLLLIVLIMLASTSWSNLARPILIVQMNSLVVMKPKGIAIESFFTSSVYISFNIGS